MSEAAAAAITETAADQAPPPETDPADALAALLEGPVARKSAPVPEKTAPKTEKSPEKSAEKGPNSKEPDHLAAANGRKPPKEPEDPLNEGDFAPEKLNSPEAMAAAAERIVKARRQAAEFMRASHRSHAAAEKREHKLTEREQTVAERERRASIIERAQSESQKALDDLETGDVDAFLQGVAKLKKTTDPIGFWKQVSLAVAQGKPVPKQQQAQADANPDLAARLERLEQHVNGKVELEQSTAFETARAELMDRNLEAAKGNSETKLVQLYASDPRTAAAVREELAVIMETAAGFRKSKYRQDGRPIDIAEACRRLESNLAVHFELSQRADGTAQARTNRENETTGSEPDAGRETSKDFPKPETSQATIPAALSSAPASAHRSMNEEEQRRLQIRQLENLGIFD